MSTTDATVSSLLHNLGGVYRDPSRVSKDATNLLRSPSGSNLRPTISSLVMNDGTNLPSVLTFSGTISMTYKGSPYNIPMDFYLPPAYPVRPPVCFVRPVATMMIKDNHKHVAPDGQVFLPYLHSWRPHSHNLVELTVVLSSLFGTNPPVFARPPGQQAVTSSLPARPAAATAGAGRMGQSLPTQPPRYEDIAARQAAEASAAAERARVEAERRAAEVQAAREAEEANRAAEAVRLADEAERQRKRDEERTTSQTRSELTEKLQLHLQMFYNDSRTAIQSDLRDQAKLETGSRIVQTHLDGLKKSKETLTKQIEVVDEKTEKIKGWIERAEGAGGGEVSADDLAAPVDVHSKQMLQLSAENAALTDALYFLDRGLVKGTLKLDAHLKYVRRLAKKQFLVRAHLMKIGQVRAAGM